LETLPFIGFAAASGTGKTTLLGKLIPLLRERGYRPGVIKHSHHDFEIDKPGKDSHRLREAGAGQVLLASAYRRFWVEELDGETEPELMDLLGQLHAPSLDLVLIEGFRDASIPKIEVHRPSLGQPPLALRDSDVVAIASDAPVPRVRDLPLLPLNEPAAIADFILRFLLPGRH
jgi:molybdopterin-guanine dinucleotide biosynthesis protein B